MHWRETTIGDVLTLQRGFDITRADQTDGPVPVISSGGVTSFHSEAMSDGPGVVIGRKGTLGKVFFSAGPYWPHDTTLWVRDFRSNLPRFVYYFFKTLDVSFLDVGSANPTLNRNHVHPIAVRWPDLTTQRAIAEVLGALDDKIAVNTHVGDTASALMASIVAGLPADALAQLAELAASRKEQVTPASMAEVAHFSLPAFDAAETPAVDSGSTIMSNKLAVRVPSVLLSRLNPRIPRVWDVPVLPESPAVASTEFLVLEPQGVSTSALWAALSQPSATGRLQELARGTSGSHQRVRPEDAMAVTIHDVRRLDDQDAQLLRDLGRRRWLARVESLHLATLRDTLLPHLMSGRITVRDAEKQVAQVL